MYIPGTALIALCGLAPFIIRTTCEVGWILWKEKTSVLVREGHTANKGWSWDSNIYSHTFPHHTVLASEGNWLSMRD